MYEYFFVLLLVDNVTTKAQTPPTTSLGDSNLNSPLESVAWFTYNLLY